MSKEVIEICKKPIVFEHRKRVAAYARVSTSKDTMLHSLATQINYYRQKILGNPKWLFAGIFADEGRTGTKEDREQFQALLAKCRSGEIDMIVTKSISRFARNTVTLLQTVRELKSYGIDVYFEEQNIHTISSDGEFLLTLLASYAQAESLSVSENCKWRIRNKYKEGQPATCTMLGYRLINGQITVVPDEAAIVRRIFEMYLAGNGTTRIANTLNAEGIPSIWGKQWHMCEISRILDNEKYCGDLHLQKYFISDHISKIRVRNTGELPQYILTDNHEAIIDKPVFRLVQEERARRATKEGDRAPFSVLTGKIHCTCCGKHFRRKTTTGGVKWCCTTYNTIGKQACPDSKMIPETTLLNTICSIMNTDVFDENAFKKQIDHIDACKENLLRFYFKDGELKEYRWQDRARSASRKSKSGVVTKEHNDSL